jgi:hypothetical protein
MQMIRRLLTTTVLSAVGILAFASTAAAQRQVPVLGEAHWGIRGGVSGEPDQGFFGVQLESAALLTGLTFRPNVEVGFGDDADGLAANFEFAYHMPFQKTDWGTYVGGGPAATFAFNSDDQTLRGGVNLFVGLEKGHRWFFEVKVGNGGTPAVRLTGGFMFK